MKKAGAVLAALCLTAVPGLAYEVREICRDVALADGTFEFTGASCAASSMIVFLPTFHFTEASIDMLSEADYDRLEEVELALLAAPDERVAAAADPWVPELAAALRLRLWETPRGRLLLTATGLERNRDLLRALQVLGLTAASREAEACATGRA